MQDICGRIQWSNPSYSRITGYSAEELLGRRPQELLLPPDRQLDPEELKNFRYDLRTFEPGFKELILNRRKNGEYFWNQLTFAQVAGDTPETTRMILICQDVTQEVGRVSELEEARKRLKHQAEHDDLTGLASRAKIKEVLQARLAAAADTGGNVGVILFDMDNFKDVNDEHGHSTGDAVLCHVAGILQSVVGDKGLVARIGGDEFLVTVSQPEGSKEMEELGHEILTKLHEPALIDTHKIRVAGSMGLVLAAAAKIGVTELINRADMALYAAKRAGRGRFAWYTDALGAAHRHRRMSMAQLDQDLETGSLSLLMEPYFGLDEQRVTGFEVFAHWLHPSEGLVDPVRFLSLEEDFKRVAQIEAFALEQGLQAVKRLRDAVGQSLAMSVNLSEASLVAAGFKDRLRRLCDEVQIALHDLTIDLEQQLIRFDEDGRMLEAIDSLEDLGCRIALDGVGSGQGGGAGQIVRIRASSLKISSWLTEDLETQVKKQYLARSIIDVAEKFGLKVAAVGVDRKEQLEILKDLGCAFVQGGIISGRVSPREAEIFLQARAGQELRL